MWTWKFSRVPEPVETKQYISFSQHFHLLYSFFGIFSFSFFILHFQSISSMVGPSWASSMAA